MILDNMVSRVNNAFETQKSADPQKLIRQSSSTDKAALKKVSQEFEAIFIKMMLDAMRTTLSDDGLIPENSGMKLFEDRLYGEYAKNMAGTANFGIATMIYDQLSDDLPGNQLDINL